jgi:putative tricarboxylic transport membrane protein
MRTRILAMVLIVLSAGIYWGTMDLVVSPFEPLGAAAFPRVIAVVVGLLSMWLLVFPNEANAPEPELDRVNRGEEAAKSTPLMAWATVACALLFAAALQTRLVSFGIAATVFLVVLMSILTRFNRNAIVMTMVLAAIFGFGLEYIFTSVFVVDLP